ncbi:MAG: hypothetical protein ACK40O_00680 [Allosphingosinicella sp.]
MVAAERGRTFLEDLSLDFARMTSLLVHYAEQDAARRASETAVRVSARQVEAVQAARYARSAVFGADLASPGWSLLLELFRAYLEKRPVRLGRLATDARVAATTALRWVELLCDGGFVRREADGERQGGVLIALTDAGVDAMEDYFVALALAWTKA